MAKLDLSGLLPEKKEEYTDDYKKGGCYDHTADGKRWYAIDYNQGWNDCRDEEKIKLEAAISSGKITINQPIKIEHQAIKEAVELLSDRLEDSYDKQEYAAIDTMIELGRKVLAGKIAVDPPNKDEIVKILESLRDKQMSGIIKAVDKKGLMNTDWSDIDAEDGFITFESIAEAISNRLKQRAGEKC